MPNPRSILVINPNTNVGMTDALKPLVHELNYNDTSYTFFTAPTGPRSINNLDDCHLSAKETLPHLLPLLSSYDAFLVACYSPHPLVADLKAQPALSPSAPSSSSSAAGHKSVTGIFEASITAALLGLAPGDRFGIVSTGAVWEDALGEATWNFLGMEQQHQQGKQDDSSSGNKKAKWEAGMFAGVTTTGLTAGELHDLPPSEVEGKMKEAVKKLLRRGRVGAICLGCAGMAGMDRWVREASVEELGEREGGKVRIVDGVLAGVGALEAAVRAGF